MRDATFDEIAWTAADDRLDALLAAAHEEVLDAIQTAQGSGLFHDGACADVVLPESDERPPDGAPTMRPSAITEDALTELPPLMPGDTAEKGQQIYAALVPDTALVSAALEGALKPLAELLASLSDAAHSNEMSGEFRTWAAAQGVQRNTSLIQDLVQRSATLGMAEAFFAELESELAREHVWRANQDRYVELVSLLRASHRAVMYLFEESDDHEKVLV
jgi:hypothetical protein